MLVVLVDAQLIAGRVDHEVLALDEAQPADLREERKVMRRIAWRGLQAANPIDPPRLLRARRQRPHRRAAQQSDKIPSPHGSCPARIEPYHTVVRNAALCITIWRPMSQMGHQRLL